MQSLFSPTTRVRIDGAAPITLADLYDANEFSTREKTWLSKELRKHGHAVFGGGAQATITVTLDDPQRRAFDVGPKPGRIATHDGIVWQHPRHAMTDVSAIDERFLADAEALLRERGEDAVIDQADFLRLGWTDMQVKLHGPQAISNATHRLQRAA